MKLDKPLLIKLVIIAALLVIAPYVVPVAFELVLFADIMGLEALLLFLLFQSRNGLVALGIKLSEFARHVTLTISMLAGLYMFQPKVCVGHIAGSSIILIFACSLFLALALWVPAIYLSTSGFV